MECTIEQDIELQIEYTDPFSVKISELLTFLFQNPNRLEEKHHTDIKRRLDVSCGNGQGLGNKCTDQEACFATVAEEFGWTHSLTDQPTSQFSYQYQLNGTQRAVDFTLISSLSKKVYHIDLKHCGEHGSMFLNDGRFVEGEIYIISFTKLLEKVKGEKKCPRQRVCVIVYGERVMTTKDAMLYEKIRKLLSEINEQDHDFDFLKIRVRGANQYVTKQFTDEFNAIELQYVLSHL